MEGWISLHRKIKISWIWDDPIKLKWWITILLEVNHESKKVAIGNKIVECKRGQSIRSLDNWAKEFRTTKKTIRTFFLMLQSDDMIKIENVQISTRITVCNYDSYNNPVNAKETVGKRLVNAKETVPTPKQECNNDNNDNNVKNKYWQALVEVWFDFNNTHFKIKPSFKGQDTKALKLLVENLERRAAENNHEWTEEYAKSVLNAFLTHSLKDKWLKENFLLPNLEKQFDKILKNAINGKSTELNADAKRKLAEELANLNGWTSNNHA